MDKKQDERKARAINRLMDAYFGSDPERRRPDAALRFLEWLHDGDCQAAKHAALYRKFSEACEECLGVGRAAPNRVNIRIQQER